MNRRILMGLGLLAVGLTTVMAVSPAAAATLHLTGPDGAVVQIDGVETATLPLDAPLSVAPGRHQLTSTLRGAHDIHREITFRRDEDVMELHLRFIPLSRFSAVTSSLLLAGSGQRYEGRHRMGNALTGLEALGLLAALTSELQARNFRDDYLIAVEAYENAVSDEDIRAWRETAAVKHDDMESAAGRRDMGLALAAGAVIVSALDAWFRFPALEAGIDLTTVGPNETALAPGSFSPRASLALTLNF